MVPTNKHQTLQAVAEAAQPAFADFFRDNYRTLIKVAIMAGATLQTAEDAVEETMLEVLRRWTDTDRPLVYPGAWARRAVVSNLRKAIRRNGRVELTADGRLDPDDEGVFDADLTTWEDQQWVEQMIEALPPAQREVMKYTMEGLKTQEIALLLGKTPPTIRKNLQLARQRLRALLPDGARADHDASTDPTVTDAPKRREAGQRADESR